MEEKRIRFVRSSLWAFANMMSSVYIVDDQCCERIRTALELTDVDKDIHAFVKNNATCQSIPTYIVFEDAMPKFVPELVMGTVNNLENDDTRSISNKSININQKSLPPAPMMNQNEQDKSNGVQYHDQVENNNDHSIVTQEPIKSSHESTSQDKQFSDATSFALKAVETMFAENELLNSSNTSSNLTEHKLPPEQIPSNQQEQQRSIYFHNRASSSVSSNSITPASASQGSKPTSLEQRRFKPIPNPAFQNQESASIHSKSSNNGSIQQQQQQQLTSTSCENIAEPITETVALVAVVPTLSSSEHVDDNNSNQMENDIIKKDDNDNMKEKDDDKKNTKEDILLSDDDESEDSHKIPVRPPPKDEKWVISSIRRPQMVPVRTQNARMYNGSISHRSSTVQTKDNHNLLEQQQSSNLPTINNNSDQHSSDTNSVGKLNRPHPPLKIEIPGTKEAAQEAIAAGRAHTQHQQSHHHHQQQPQYQQQQQQQPIQNDTIGIRPPPWDGLSNQSNGPPSQYSSFEVSSSPQYNQRYSQQPPSQQHQQQQGLQRYGSVSGPRVASEKMTGNMENDGSHGKGGNNKNGLEFGKFMKGVLKSNDGRPLSNDVTNTLQENNKKEKGGGRFSLGIFSNKKEKEKRSGKEGGGRDSTLGQRPTQGGDVFISGPPGGVGPIQMDNGVNHYNNNNNNSNSNSNSYAETKVIPTIPVNQQPQSQQNYNLPSSNLQSPSPKESVPTSGYNDPKQLLDGTPILHYARAVWSFTATVSHFLLFF
ncbi:unnamed protein product [Cunninghamella echinulata]